MSPARYPLSHIAVATFAIYGLSLRPTVRLVRSEREYSSPRGFAPVQYQSAEAVTPGRVHAGLSCSTSRVTHVKIS